MIYGKDNVYYLKKGNEYEIANISIKYNRIKKKNVLVITGSGIIEQLEEPIEEYKFKEKMNSKLSITPMIFYCELETPYVVDLGVVDMPITYDGTTNLSIDSYLLPQINAKYYRNFISTVRNLQVNEKALKQELIDINTRLSVLETAQTNVVSESEVVE